MKDERYEELNKKERKFREPKLREAKRIED
jgi:hypothetical protein